MQPSRPNTPLLQELISREACGPRRRHPEQEAFKPQRLTLELPLPSDIPAVRRHPTPAQESVKRGVVVIDILGA